MLWKLFCSTMGSNVPMATQIVICYFHVVGMARPSFCNKETQSFRVSRIHSFISLSPHHSLQYEQPRREGQLCSARSFWETALLLPVTLSSPALSPPAHLKLHHCHFQMPARGETKQARKGYTLQWGPLRSTHPFFLHSTGENLVTWPQSMTQEVRSYWLARWAHAYLRLSNNGGRGEWIL